MWWGVGVAGLCDQGIGRPQKGFGVCYSVPWAATEGFEWGQGCFQVLVFTLSFWPWSGGWVRRGEVGRGVHRKPFEEAIAIQRLSQAHAPSF